MYSAGPSDPQLSKVPVLLFYQDWDMKTVLEVPQQSNHLEVDLVPIPAHPVDQQPSIVPLEQD